MQLRLPTTHPLPAPSPADARATQFRLMECVARHLDGDALLTADYGVTPEHGRPRTTALVERVLAEFFGTEACALVQGAGTGAIRSMLLATVVPTGQLLIHREPPYATTRATFESMALRLVTADLDDPASIDQAAARLGPGGVAYVQHARHDVEDGYDVPAVVERLRRADLRVVTDENYTVFKVHRIGVELGADASAFSLFKMLGPEGVGCVVGRADVIERVHDANYSGGGQVQGPQALDALRSLVLAPVLWAVQAEVVDELVARLEAGEVPGVAGARVVNAQDRMALVLLDEPLARRVVEVSARFGAQNYPVGANSRYEIAPFVYRLSGANLEARPELADYALRVNPVRAGADLVLSILRRSLKVARAA